MARSVDRYARHSEGCTGITNVANVFGTRVANTISASETYLAQTGRTSDSKRSSWITA
jgi:hypothetical protein